jgi:hypothetical protein
MCKFGDKIGGLRPYEKDSMHRLGQDSIIPHRLKYKKFKR